MERPSISQLQEIFYADRVEMDRANKDIDFIVFRLLQEVEELQNAPTNHLGKEKHQVQEFVDIILFAMAGIRTLGADPDLEVREKMAKNALKYQPQYFVSGLPYETGVRVSKQEAESTHLDDWFYETS